jgi:hypothetical protein
MSDDILNVVGPEDNDLLCLLHDTFYFYQDIDDMSTWHKIFTIPKFSSISQNRKLTIINMPKNYLTRAVCEFGSNCSFMKQADNKQTLKAQRNHCDKFCHFVRINDSKLENERFDQWCVCDLKECELMHLCVNSYGEHICGNIECKKFHISIKDRSIYKSNSPGWLEQTWRCDTSYINHISELLPPLPNILSVYDHNLDTFYNESMINSLKIKADVLPTNTNNKISKAIVPKFESFGSFESIRTLLFQSFDSDTLLNKISAFSCVIKNEFFFRCYYETDMQHMFVSWWKENTTNPVVRYDESQKLLCLTDYLIIKHLSQIVCDYDAITCFLCFGSNDPKARGLLKLVRERDSMILTIHPECFLQAIL